MKLLIFVAGIVTFCSSAMADPQPKGFIQNDQGGQCWYTQVTTRGAIYFHSIPGTTSTLTFDDPMCMKEGALGQDVNKMLINIIIARNYSHSNANYKTRPGEMYKTSVLQMRGQCIQSATYPSIGVLVEYHQNKSAIYMVKHSASAGRCSNTAVTNIN